MSPLPAGLAEPLHLDLPIPWRALAMVAALLLLSLVATLLLWWLRRRRRAAPRALPAPAPRRRAAGIVEAIEALRRKHRRSRAVRRACHELSVLLREHFESGFRGFVALTAGEIRGRFGEHRRSRFFELLARLQFGRSQPTRNDFEGICDLAVEVVGEEGE